MAGKRQGFDGLLWFRSGGYVTRLNLFHCPANTLQLRENDLTTRDRLPDLSGWNNYDMYYRRNFWNPGTMNFLVGDRVEDRHLLQPYPPADTVVTWCANHRLAKAPRGPGIEGPVSAGDKDLVLFADGSVHRMASRKDNRMFEEPKNDTGWPAGPVM